MKTEDAVADDILRTCDAIDEVVKGLQEMKDSLVAYYEEAEDLDIDQELQDVIYAKEQIREQGQALWNAGFTLSSCVRRIQSTKLWRQKTKSGKLTKRLCEAFVSAK